MKIEQILKAAPEWLSGAPLLQQGAPLVDSDASRAPEQARDARRLMRQLIAARLQLSPAQLFAYPERELSEAQCQNLRRDCEQLRDGVPLAYVIGETPFLEWSFRSDVRALAPRPETEALAQLVLEAARELPPRRLLDLCCGSGVLGLALAAAFPDCLVDLTDLSAPALELARENAERLGLGERVAFYEGDLFEALARLDPPPRYSWILANPPYVAPDDQVQSTVLRHEPELALWSGDDGQAHIKRILLELDRHLELGGRAAFELGHRHHQTLAPWLERHCRRSWRFAQDPFGVPRFLLIGFPPGS